MLFDNFDFFFGGCGLMTAKQRPCTHSSITVKVDAVIFGFFRRKKVYVFYLFIYLFFFCDLQKFSLRSVAKK